VESAKFGRGEFESGSGASVTGRVDLGMEVPGTISICSLSTVVVKFSDIYLHKGTPWLNPH
jgi:hypothetical protein